MDYIFRDIITFNQALGIIDENIEKMNEMETIDLKGSNGRITCSDVYSINNLPIYSRSQVDGYAIISEDTKNADKETPVKLLLSGETNIGEPAILHPGHGKCIKVPTGGTIPVYADAMIPFEDAEIVDDGIIIKKPIPVFNEISNSGIDVTRNEKIINKYTMIEPRHIAVIASTGSNEINVFVKIKIGIVSTGTELLYPGDPYIEGKIYESNGLSIESELSKYSTFSIKNYGIIEDDNDSIQRAILKSINENDITITVGSTSAGEHDMVYKILENLNPGILFHGLKVRPGKPMVFAKSGEKVIFGLPGFPVSSMMLLYSIVIPKIFLMYNYNFEYPVIHARTAEQFNLHRGNTDLLLVKLLRRNGEYFAYQVGGDSGSISRIMKSNGFSIFYSNEDHLKKSSELDVIPFNTSIPEILIYGQYSPLLNKIPYNINSRSIFIEKSYDDIEESLEKNEADMYIMNYRNYIKNNNYENLKLKMEYGLIYNVLNYNSISVMYEDSGLYETSRDKIKKCDNIIYLDNNEIINDYVKNKRSDAGITYKCDIDKDIPYEKLGDIIFYFYINKKSRNYEELSLSIKTLIDNYSN